MPWSLEIKGSCVPSEPHPQPAHTWRGRAVCLKTSFPCVTNCHRSPWTGCHCCHREMYGGRCRIKDVLHLDKVIRCIITLEPGVWGIIHTDYFFQDGQLLIRTQGSWVCDLGQVICFGELYLLTSPQSVDEQSLPTSPQGASASPPHPNRFFIPAHAG